MARAKNKVIAGEYQGRGIIAVGNTVKIVTGFAKSITLNKDVVDSYELATDEHRKSASSGISKGLVGGFLLGPVGALGGVLSAKSIGIYQIAIQFKDGKKSLIEVDDKIYKVLIKSLF